MKHADCNHRERILRDAEPQALAALETHAATCAACRAELAAWNELSAAARSLRREWDSPELWPRIRQSLAEEMAAARERQAARSEWAIPPFWRGWGRGWQMAAALVVLSALSVSSVWLVVHTGEAPLAVQPAETAPASEAEQRLLTERALRQIEQDEARYMRSIERLARLAQPRLEDPATPLVANYREKLVVLDAAIAELAAEAERNPFNAHLRGELLSLYQDKARTLEAVMRSR